MILIGPSFPFAYRTIRYIFSS